MPFLTVVRLSPRGFDPVILVHEASHVALHGRLGTIRLLSGAVPAWFDEGLAVIVSGDARYLAPGSTAAERCTAEPTEMPASPWTWAREAGRRTTLYAETACTRPALDRGKWRARRIARGARCRGGGRAPASLMPQRHGGVAGRVAAAGTRHRRGRETGPCRQGRHKRTS